MSKWNSKLNGVILTPSTNIDLIKAKLKKDEPKQGIKTLLEDPLDVNSLGYKERKYSLDFNILRTIPSKSGFISAILQTRCAQVSSFAVPFRNSKSIGYQIKHKNAARLTTRGEREKILELENYIYNCGFKDQNPFNTFKRDNFKVFLSKLVRDSLTLDAAVAEVVPTRSGIPYEFLAVDGASIRIASADFGDDTKAWAKTHNTKVPTGKQPAYVQLVDGQIVNVYGQDELIYGVRNHRSDMAIGGYGYSELEMLINIITAHINAETYNAIFFKQGTSPKGMINFKGDSMTPDQMEAFRRQWRDQMEGVNSFWRTPIFQSEGGVEWVDLHTSNRDMEYGQWLEYLVKIIAGVFNIDPAEVNFELSGGVSETPLFQASQDWKLKASKDRGLRPLLAFFESMINENILSRLADDFVFEFVGLDELSAKEKNDLRKDEISTYKTINEIRRAEDRPDIEGGDIILNPTYVQYLQLKKQNELAQQQQQTAPQEGQTPQQQQGTQPQEQQSQEEVDIEDHVPQYVS